MGHHAVYLPEDLGGAHSLDLNGRGLVVCDIQSQPRLRQQLEELTCKEVQGIDDQQNTLIEFSD